MFWFPLCRGKSEAERLSNLFMVTELVNGEAKILCKVPGFYAKKPIFLITILFWFYHTNGASLVGQLVKNPPAMQENLVRFLGWEDLERRDKLPTSVFLGFPGGLAGPESACDVGDLGSISWLGISLGKGTGCPLQYSVLENSRGCISLGLQSVRHKWLTFTFIKL